MPKRLKETMIRSDFHMHTAFSTDSEEAVESMLNRAVERGLYSVCITDHMDADYPPDDEMGESAFRLDTENYFPYLLKKKKLKRGASMVITSSIAGVCSVDIGNTLYSVSKSAVDGFMKNAAKELAEKGIRVNSVNPGMVDTPINDYTQVYEEQKQADLTNYPLKRHGKPEEIAYAIIYLLSDAAAWVTGTALKIDGGYSL